MDRKILEICPLWEGQEGSLLCGNKQGERQMRLRTGVVWSPVSVTPGWDRVAILTLLCEVENQSATRAPNSITHQRRERGTGLGTLLHDHSYIPSGAMGRARSRDTGSHPFPDPPCKSPLHGCNAYVHKGMFPIPHLHPNPHLDSHF